MLTRRDLRFSVVLISRANTFGYNLHSLDNKFVKIDKLKIIVRMLVGR